MIQLKYKSNLLAPAIDGSTAIHVAAAKGHHEVIQLFLSVSTSYGLSASDLLNCKDNEKQLPFHRAAQGGHVEVIMNKKNHIFDLYIYAYTSCICIFNCHTNIINAITCNINRYFIHFHT